MANAWRLAYIGWDFVGAFLAYTLLYTFRKSILEPARFGVPEMAWDNFYVYGSLLTAGMWVGAMGMVGLYLRPLRKSRLKELSRALQVWAVFSVLYFIFFLLDDYVDAYSGYFKSAGLFAGTLFIWTIAGKIILGYVIRFRIKRKKFTFPTLLIGERAILSEHMDGLVLHAQSSGEILAGWINTEEHADRAPLNNLPMRGDAKEVKALVERLHVEDCILAIPGNQHDRLTPLILELEMLGTRIFMLPDTYGILSGMVGIDEHGLPLMEWHLEP
ncbi:MAG: nucleoside-diphosphate sugar epimerase/dehydratase, partial [Schleiferiaceae bacterium]